MRSAKELSDYLTKYTIVLKKIREMQIPDIKTEYSINEICITDTDKRRANDNIASYEIFTEGKVSALRYILGAEWDDLNT